MFYAISLSLGIILLIVSLCVLRETLIFLKKSERTTATVIEMERVEGSESVTYKPIFAFRTLNNKEFTYRKAASSSPASWSVGEEATIAYDPNNPDSARLLTYFETFSWTIILMAISMPMIVVGGGFYIAKSFLRP